MDNTQKSVNKQIMDEIEVFFNRMEKEIFPMDISNINIKDQCIIEEYIKEDEWDLLDEYFNYQDFPNLYKRQIKETLGKDESYPTIFDFILGNNNLKYIRALETSDIFKKHHLYRFYIDFEMQVVWVMPKGVGTKEMFPTLELFKNISISFPQLTLIEKIYNS